MRIKIKRVVREEQAMEEEQARVFLFFLSSSLIQVPILMFLHYNVSKNEKKKLEKLLLKGRENATPTPSAPVSEARTTTSKPSAASFSTLKTST
ncbi:hypothetical protein C5167_015032 [Papaver somniferum]|uniref:Uncharacterized protein n=1 Tax=Papaver somniferum TaxID=3469 RepID=A0A4Y7J4X2_PAPSO|nr:hypothetical protein C5167_015032 [Papaver somniferum]